MNTFDSTKRLLPEILAEIVKAKIQLPDFQRGWVWDDQHIRSLLVSIARSFPIGAVMLLETGGDVKFQVRPVEGISPPSGGVDAELLILDGQQRLTTLTQVLVAKEAVKTRTEKGNPIRRRYYWNIEVALKGEDRLEDAIEAVEEDRTKRSNFGRQIDLDLSTTQKECEQLYFPCDQTLNSDAWEEALQKYAPEKFGQYMSFRREVLNAFRNYQLPVIELGRDTTREAVCLVFEKVNTGGVPLNVFELVTASYAVDHFNLRDDWYGNTARNILGRYQRLCKEALLSEVEPTDFLQAVSMLHTLELRGADIAAGKTGKLAQPVSAKRVSILAMPLSAYKKWADKVEEGFRLASRFLRKECVISPRELPYRSQLAPLAAVLADLRERWLEPRIYQKLSRWYWNGVLGELYGSAIETRMVNDVEDLVSWIKHDAAIPRTITDATFNPGRLDTMTSRVSAAYKGLNVLVLREGAQDFFWKASIQELDKEGTGLDIHHIFPQDWCEKNGIKRAVYNSAVNKTPISYKANRMIGGSAPSIYLAKLQMHKQVQLTEEEMNEIVGSHLIDTTALRANNFESFYKARKAALVKLVERAMGKSVAAVMDETEFDESEEDDSNQ
jgi:conserved hypothetical protein